jgi:pimeloyl-ACP methyl ester carboxylesterase
MENLRKYGNRPFSVAVIHGGPGAPGEMASVARELSSIRGILEPLQTAKTLEGQVQELKTVLENDGDLPVTLIGFSWGAWLSYILAAGYPSIVEKLVLVSSGVYEEKYAVEIMRIRMSRISQEEGKEFVDLMETLINPASKNRGTLMSRLGELTFKSDSYDPLPRDNEILDYQYDVYHGVREQASKLRSSGKLLDMGTEIQCPVIAIHGDYDPHVAEGVREPLSRVLKDFRFILLEKCGHYPWLERNARDRFYAIIKNEIVN